MGFMGSVKESLASHGAGHGKSPMSMVKSRSNSDDIDGEMLSEANAQGGQYGENSDLEQQDRELDNDLQWAVRAAHPKASNASHLRHPVLVPQDAPGIQSAFIRAWSPVLADHDVTIEEFMQFIDHLNVCKNASPPFQILNMAGMVAGFVPNHFAQIAGAATQAVAIGGMVTVSKVRVGRYLERANEQYFAPRGLRVRIAKFKILSQITGQPEGAPLLSEPPDMNADPSQWPSLMERRLQAMQGYIAPLQLTKLPAPQQEQNAIDKMSAKMLARKNNKSNAKSIEDRQKGVEDADEERGKLDEKMYELQREVDKVNREAQKELRKKPEDASKIEHERQKELRKIEKDMKKEEDDYLEKSGKGGKKEDKKAKKFMFIVVQNLDDPIAGDSNAGQGQQQSAGMRALR